MNNHTPGPWYPVEYAGRFELQATPFYSLNDILDAERVGYETAKANSHLAAAAPDMLEALKKVSELSSIIVPSEVNEEHEGEAIALHNMILLIQRAIAKAEGRKG